MGNELIASFADDGGSSSLAMPGLANLAAYGRHVNALPMITAERELACARALRDEGSLDAAKELVMSHLRLVVKIAKEHRGYGLPQEDLIQEGNVGLMLAVKKFDPEMGVRLAAYAAIWIKSEIQEYVLSNWRLVKIGAAKGLKKLFFNLRRLQEQMHGVPRLRQKEEIARLLGVEGVEVERAIQWFAGVEVPILERPEDAEESFEPRQALPAPRGWQPEVESEAREAEQKLPSRLRAALDVLSERERAIVTARYLDEKGATLADLAAEWGVSLERVRQIEVAALRRLRESHPDLRAFL